MPGYGYAAAAKTKIKAWTALIHAFLKGRANLARVYVLVDAPQGSPKEQWATTIARRVLDRLASGEAG
jgi:GTP-binding protein EngB required for normal cell division